MKKFSPVFFAFLIGAAAGILFVLPGFQKRTDVFLRDFSVSEDGSAITVKTFSLDSMSSTRAMEAKQIGDEIHCSFYRTFGWLNSSLGAENTFEIRLNHPTERIYLDRGTSFDQLVLERDADTGAWTSISPLPQ